MKHGRSGERKKGKRKSRRIQDRRAHLIEMGERVSKKEEALVCGAVLLISVLLGLGMCLRWQHLLAAVFLCVIQVPGLYLGYKQAHHERRRFNDINSYMCQMAQSFAETGKILLALKETRKTFTKGHMRQSLTGAISEIEKGYDVVLAEQEALERIKREYDCERIRVLHDFLMKAEGRGGSCEKEFRLLEQIRQLWEQTTIKYRNTVFLARNLVTFEYILLMAVCIFMLHQFPKELTILHLPLVQVLNAGLIVCFFLVFSRMDKKLRVSMLKDRKPMSESRAREKIHFIQEFQGREMLIKQLPLAVAEAALTTLFFIFSRSVFGLVMGMLVCMIFLFWQHGKYLLTFQEVKREIKAAFPCWLFDVLLLVQQENVTVALFKSVKTAPPVLKEHLEKLRDQLTDNPLSSDAFLSFLAEFQLPEVEGIMRKLYGLTHGTGATEEVLNLIIDANMRMLAEENAQQLRLKGELFSVYYMLPTVPIMVCMAGYGAALMYVIFKNIMTVI